LIIHEILTKKPMNIISFSFAVTLFMFFLWTTTISLTNIKKTTIDYTQFPWILNVVENVENKEYKIKEYTDEELFRKDVLYNYTDNYIYMFNSNFSWTYDDKIINNYWIIGINNIIKWGETYFFYKDEKGDINKNFFR